MNGPVSVRNGNFNTTNANLTLGNVTVGSGAGSPDPYTPDAVFTQDGGSIAARSIDIRQGGTYHLNSGLLYTINGTTCTGCPFFQYGGTNYGDITTLSYYCRLRAGMVQGNVLTAINGSGFVHDAGLLDMKVINITGTTNWPAWLARGFMVAPSAAAPSISAAAPVSKCAGRISLSRTTSTCTAPNLPPPTRAP